MRPTSSETSTRPSPAPRELGGLAAWLVLALVLIGLGFAGAGEAPGDLLYRYDFAVGTVATWAVLLAVTFAVALAYEKPLPALGIRRFAPRWLAIALGLIVLAAIVSLVLEQFLHAGEEQGLAPEEWRPDRAWAFALNGLVITTVVPLGEEVFFRGLGVRALQPLGDVAAVAGTAVAFALAHGLLAGLPPLFLFGLAVGWVRLRSGSVWPAVVAHGLYNGLGLLAIAFAWRVE